MKPYKTTKRDFEIFVKECEKWIKILGLNDWEFYFNHKNTEGARAAYELMEDAMIVNIYLSNDWQYKPKSEEIKVCARHEIIHVLLAPLCNRLCNVYSYSFLEPIEHGVLHKIQELMS